jgi:hypothetical protein
VADLVGERRHDMEAPAVLCHVVSIRLRLSPWAIALISDLQPRPAQLAPDGDGECAAFPPAWRMAYGVGDQLGSNQFKVINTGRVREGAPHEPPRQWDACRDTPAGHRYVGQFSGLLPGNASSSVPATSPPE